MNRSLAGKAAPFLKAGAKTAQGLSWAMRATHPCDTVSSGEVTGIPDTFTMPTLMRHFKNTFTLSPPNQANAAWRAEVTVLPHPIQPLCFATNDDNGHASIVECLNSALAGNTHTEKYQSFKDEVQAWRLAYYSVTIRQDAAAVADQGMISAAQYPAAPIETNYFVLDDVQKGCGPHVVAWNAEDNPDYAMQQNLPNSYLGASRDGLYMPLKLDHIGKWHSEKDQITIVPYNETDPATEVIFGSIQLPDATQRQCWPFPGLECAWQTVSPVGGGLSGYGVNYGGECTSNVCNLTFGGVGLRNLALTTTFSCTVYMGYECIVSPSSVLTSFLKPSPVPDRGAIDAYCAVVRELKDAYPEEMNSSNQLWDVISQVLGAAQPLLSLIPDIGGVLSTGAGLARGIGDKIVAGMANGESSSQAVASEVRSQANRVLKRIAAQAPLAGRSRIIAGVRMPRRARR